MTGTPRLAIFDFDGTLADSGHWYLSIADEMAARFRFRRVGEDEIEMLRGRSTAEVIRYLGIPRWKLPVIARHLHKQFAANCGGIALFPGVAELLRQLSDAGVQLAVVTSNSEANARRILGPANAALIGYWAAGASLFGKAPKFRKVLKQAGVTPDEAISIGDETRDIVAAREVGLRAAAVLWGYASRDALGQFSPDLYFTAPDEILPALSIA